MRGYQCYVLQLIPILSVVHCCCVLGYVHTFIAEPNVAIRTSLLYTSSIPTSNDSKRRRRKYYSYYVPLRSIDDRIAIRMMPQDEDFSSNGDGDIVPSDISQPLSELASPTLAIPTRSAASITGTVATATMDHHQAKILSQFERTQKHFEKLQQRQQQQRNFDDNNDIDSNDIRATPSAVDIKLDPIGMERERIYESYIQLPAADLKRQCGQRQLSEKGRKPDLAQRLTQDDIISMYGLVDHGKENDDMNEDLNKVNVLSNGMVTNDSTTGVLTNFAGLYPLSSAAQSALTLAQFMKPTTIQSKAIPIISSDRSVIIHAATGSGKTLAYILPFTERLWHERQPLNNKSHGNDQKIALILTPSRELAAQVAGIASVLAPPGTVRFVTRPSNLLSRMKQERTDGTNTVEATTRIYVGSAKAIYQSLYGDGRMPASPTTKPEAMYLLQNTGYLVLDEVDRLLGVVGGVNNNNVSHGKKSKSQDSRNDNAQKGIHHEKPAAILTAAVARLTLGKATTVAASATVGRPLRRELARCMGLTPQECPMIVRENDVDDDIDGNVNTDKSKDTAAPEPQQSNIGTTGRAVTIPSTVSHFVIPVIDGASPGKILTTAFTTIQALGRNRRMLLVLTRNFGITTQNAIGALKHFRCQPEPISLLDALETTDGTEAMMEVHRQVTGVRGVGASQSPLPVQQEQGYLLVTGEDSVRGLHLDGLDVVIVASRSVGPDEYTHIAGRTGRAGKSGSVINVVSDVDVNKVTAWEKMLNITFVLCPTPKEIGSLIER